MYRTIRTIRTATTAAVLLTALSGCSLIAALNEPPTSSPDAAEASEGQSAKAACDLLLPVLIDVNGRITAAYSDLQTDPEKTGPLFHDISTDLHDTLDEIVNVEVHTVASTAVDSLDALVVELDDSLAGNPDQTALLAAATAVSQDFAAIDPVCQAAGAE
jgi:hypothetical protein